MLTSLLKCCSHGHLLLAWWSEQRGEHFGSPCTHLGKGEGLSGPALLLKEQSGFAQDAGKSLDSREPGRITWQSWASHFQLLWFGRGFSMSGIPWGVWPCVALPGEILPSPGCIQSGSWLRLETCSLLKSRLSVARGEKGPQKKWGRVRLAGKSGWADRQTRWSSDLSNTPTCLLIFFFPSQTTVFSSTQNMTVVITFLLQYNLLTL